MLLSNIWFTNNSYKFLFSCEPCSKWCYLVNGTFGNRDCWKSADTHFNYPPQGWLEEYTIPWSTRWSLMHAMVFSCSLFQRTCPLYLVIWLKIWCWPTMISKGRQKTGKHGVLQQTSLMAVNQWWLVVDQFQNVSTTGRGLNLFFLLMSMVALVARHHRVVTCSVHRYHKHLHSH
jgi:hypothetical protein